ncbi:PH domain-containing protein [Actinocrinis sp.]|uniref:PH domain-containing protein n=1 Tax=Actinocrinis sp. TaxID=1920516 RepID=UPI002B7063C0|nr:PH domain-containing protein [Actinocrinis sp.]HXR72800.1 PH domain-containing protein [Actinocrinis sp.]
MNQAAAGVDWSVPRRTHPWSIVVNAVHEARRVLSGLVVAVVSGRALGGGELVEVIIPVAAALLGVLAWVRTSFRVAPEEFRLDSGVLFRQSRTARFDRIQAVDVDQPVLARMFGLAELRLQLGGGRHGHFRLACVRQEEAARLRAFLLSRVEQVVAVEGHAGTNQQADEGEPGAQRALAYHGGVPYGLESDEVALAVVPHGRFLASWALSPAVWFAALAAAANIAVVATGSVHALSGTIPETIAAIGLAWERLQRYYGFTLSLSRDGIRLRHGLLNRYAQTVPVNRLQAIEISQPLLWRAAGWARVRMNVAGYAHGGGRGEPGRRTTAVLLPVAPVGEAFAVVGHLLGIQFADVRLRPVPDRARWRAFFWRRSYAFGFDDTVVIARRGLLHPRYSVIPHVKVQSLHLIQGPWQRSLSLASVALHTARGPVRILLRHRDIAEAQQFLEEQSTRSATARRIAV